MSNKLFIYLFNNSLLIQHHANERICIKRDVFPGKKEMRLFEQIKLGPHKGLDFLEIKYTGDGILGVALKRSLNI